MGRPRRKVSKQKAALRSLQRQRRKDEISDHQDHRDLHHHEHDSEYSEGEDNYDDDISCPCSCANPNCENYSVQAEKEYCFNGITGAIVHKHDVIERFLEAERAEAQGLEVPVASQMERDPLPVQLYCPHRGSKPGTNSTANKRCHILKDCLLNPADDDDIVVHMDDSDSIDCMAFHGQVGFMDNDMITDKDKFYDTYIIPTGFEPYIYREMDRLGKGHYPVNRPRPFIGAMALQQSLSRQSDEDLMKESESLSKLIEMGNRLLDKDYVAATNNFIAKKDEMLKAEQNLISGHQFAPLAPEQKATSSYHIYEHYDSMDGAPIEST